MTNTIAHPAVVVVIPCYGQAHLLPECLASVRAQTVSDWEAVVVDDAAPDGPEMRRVVAALADARIRLLRHATNLGVGAARNSGIAASTAPDVMCLDADDLLAPTFLEHLLPVLHGRPPADCVICDMRLFGADARDLPCHVPAPGEILRDQPLPPTALMTRRLWERIGGYDEERLVQPRADWEFYIRAFSGGCRAAHVAEPLFLYRTAATSMNIAAREREHLMRGYIYRKHRALFDAAGEGRAVRASGYDRAATAAGAQGRGVRMLWLAGHAFLLRPSRRRLKQVLRGARVASGLPGPRMLAERWAARRRSAPNDTSRPFS